MQVGLPCIRFESAEETAVRQEVVEDEEAISETLEEATAGHVTNEEEAIPEQTTSKSSESSKFKNQCYFNNDLDQSLLNFAVLQPAIKS